MPLYLSPLGESLREFFVSSIQQESSGSTALLLPSGWLVQEVRRQYPMLQDKVMTLDAFLKKCGAGEAENNLSRLAQEFLLRSLLNEHSFPYFSKIRDQQALPAQLAGVISSLIRGNVTPSEFSQALQALQEGNVSAKNREMAFFYHVYMNNMEDKNKVDVDLLCCRFLEALKKGNTQIPFAKIYAVDFFSFSPLELALLQELTKHCELSVGIVYEKERERIFRASERTVSALQGFLSVAERNPMHDRQQELEPFQFLRAAWPDIPDKEEPGVIVAEAPGVRQEIAYVAREIKQLLLKGIPSDEIVVSARDLSTYNGIRNQFSAAGIPVRLPNVAAMSEEPLALAIDSLLHAAVTGQRTDLSVAIKLPVWNMPADASELLEKWLAEKTGERYAAVPDERCPEELRPLLETVLGKIALIPRKARPQVYIDLVSGWLDEIDWPKRISAWHRGGGGDVLLVKRALLVEKALRKYFEDLAVALEIAGETDREIARSAFYEWYHRFVQETSFTLTGGEDDGVWVLPAASLTGIKKQVVFLMGVEEESFPKNCSENWLYSQDERKLLADLGVDLGVREQSLAEDALFFASVLAVAKEKFYLSFNREDNKTPSRYLAPFLQSGQVQKPLLSALFPVDRPENALHPLQLAVSMAYTGTPLSTLQELQLLGTAAGSALLSEQDRQSPQSPYNGQILNDDALTLARKRIGDLFSVTSLELYYECPFRYFVEKLLRISSWEDEEGIVRPDLIGSMYHAVLAAYMKKTSSKKIGQEKAKLLMSCFREEEENMRKGGLLRAPAWTFELVEIRKNLLAWLDYEAQVETSVGGYRRHWLEWPFGRGDDAKTRFSLDTPAGDVRLQGVIDRIDQTADGLMLLDYKKNTCPTAKARSNGGDLQLMVYLLAVETFLSRETQTPILGGTYYSLEKREAAAGLWVPEIKQLRGDLSGKKISAEEWAAFRDTTSRLIGEATAAMRNGHFAPVPLNACSSFCSARAFCRKTLLNNGEEALNYDA